MKKLYAILDRAAPGVLGGVHVFPSDTAAIRFFGDLVSDPNTMMGRHPKDHDLLCIASMDDENGELLTEGFPSVIITGAALYDAIEAQRKAQEKS